MTDDQLPRTRGEVTVTVTIDDIAQKFTADTTTTGSPVIATRKLVMAVHGDAQRYIGDLGDGGDPGQPTGARRRAAVAASATADGVTGRVEMDTTTTGSVHAAASSLVDAFQDELLAWLRSLEETGRYPR